VPVSSPELLLTIEIVQLSDNEFPFVIPFRIISNVVFLPTFVGALKVIWVEFAVAPVIVYPENVPPVKVLASVPAGKLIVTAAPELIL